MKNIEGHYHPVRTYLAPDYLLRLGHKSLEQDFAPYTLKPNDNSRIDGFGVRCRITIIEKGNLEEIFNCTVESGINFSNAESAKDDLELMPELIKECFNRGVIYIIQNAPINLINEDIIIEPDHMQIGNDVFIKLVKDGLYS